MLTHAELECAPDLTETHVASEKPSKEVETGRCCACGAALTSLTVAELCG